MNYYFVLSCAGFRTPQVHAPVLAVPDIQIEADETTRVARTANIQTQRFRTVQRSLKQPKT